MFPICDTVIKIKMYWEDKYEQDTTFWSVWLMKLLGAISYWDALHKRKLNLRETLEMW